jgi:hypothetical protein
MTTITCTVNKKYRKRTKPDLWWSTFGITTREISSLSVKKRSRQKWYQFSNICGVHLRLFSLAWVRVGWIDLG